MAFENIDPTREQFDEQNKIRAKERNKHRSLGQKLLGKDKVAGVDMAEEQAREMNTAAEQLVEQGEIATVPEAIEKVNSTEEFSLKGGERIQKEEAARAKVLDAVRAMNEGDYKKARTILLSDNLGNGFDKETQDQIDRTVRPLIKKRIIESIKQKNGDELIKILESLTNYVQNLKGIVDWVKPEDLKDIPKESLHSPEILEKVRAHLNDDLQRQPTIFDYAIEKYSQFGFFTKEEITSFPEIKETATKLLKQSPVEEPNYSSSAVGDLGRLFRQPTFSQLRNIFLKAGIFTEAEIEQIKRK